MKFIMMIYDTKIIEEYLLKIMSVCIDTVNSIKIKKSELKKDGTVVTQADKRVHSTIEMFLLKFNSNIPIISEEGNFNDQDFEQNIYWLIDPIDGTQNYSNGGLNYTINIALIDQGEPVLGIIGHPPTKSIWFGSKDIAYKKINKKKYFLKTITKISKPKIIVSGSLDKKTHRFIQKIEAAELKKFSSSIKFCKLAEGLADIYPRLNGIKKWDIAAGDAILRAAGGMLLDARKEEYNYKSPTSDSGVFFAVSSKQKWLNLLHKLI
tara:strand:- start:4062 stop:4856 length:795 start_codon:yes stop_codon:yes gene_type:complete